MRQATFTYTDKDNIKHPFTVDIMNDLYVAEQEYPLKALRFTRRKLFDTIGKTFDPRHDHKVPVIKFSHYEAIDMEQDEIKKAKAVLKKHGYVGVDSMFQLADIIGRGKDRGIDISEGDAKVIADKIDSYHDANIGINWENIDYHTDDYMDV